jgi:hypothetical protein
MDGIVNTGILYSISGHHLRTNNLEAARHTAGTATFNSSANATKADCIFDTGSLTSTPPSMCPKHEHESSDAHSLLVGCWEISGMAHSIQWTHNQGAPVRAPRRAVHSAESGERAEIINARQH